MSLCQLAVYVFIVNKLKLRIKFAFIIMVLGLWFSGFKFLPLCFSIILPNPLSFTCPRLVFTMPFLLYLVYVFLGVTCQVVHSLSPDLFLECVLCYSSSFGFIWGQVHCFTFCAFPCVPSPVSQFLDFSLHCLNFCLYHFILMDEF